MEVFKEYHKKLKKFSLEKTWYFVMSSMVILGGSGEISSTTFLMRGFFRLVGSKLDLGCDTSKMG